MPDACQQPQTRHAGGNRCVWFRFPPLLQLEEVFGGDLALSQPLEQVVTQRGRKTGPLDRRHQSTEATAPHGRAVADLAIAESLTIAATFGRTDVVQARIASLDGRNIRGPAGARVARARETAGMIASHPEGIIASGRVLWALRSSAGVGASRTNSGVVSGFSRVGCLTHP
ncbi:MAG TPA: hypothetical protein VH702_19400 [Vicinamibacterales bacterium]